ncbi:hypothetical protein FRC12_016291 [Ceratobasidium sp. 428]|nr:hypothetical protein FRC12_016291 [Ceratobasidium sp. 428]
MNRTKSQDKVAIEHLEDSKSATFSEDTEPAQRHRGIDQEIAQFTAQHAVEIDEQTNSRLLKMINKRVLLVMLVTYFIQSLDKGTMSFAAIMNIQKVRARYVYGETPSTSNNLVSPTLLPPTPQDANLHGQEYAALTTIFYAGSLVAEFPVNVLCQKFPIGKCALKCRLWG